jgi:heptaprenyl diphosphate synthase
MSVQRLTRTAMLLSLGLALHLAENALALPVLLPGAKLGLANLATLLVLAEFGAGAAALFGPVRHLLGAAASGTLFLPTFWLGFVGSATAGLALWLLARDRRLHTAGVLSGAAFQVGQSAALVLLAGSAGAWSYLPPLLALGVGAGWLTGLLAQLLGPRLGYLAPVRRDTPWLLTAGLLAAALAAAGFVAVAAPKARGDEAAVLVAGHERLVLPLDQDGRHALALADGHMVLEVKDGAVRVAESDCDDQVCVRTGWIRTPGRPILCAPYRVLVAVRGQAGEVDGTLR